MYDRMDHFAKIQSSIQLKMLHTSYVCHAPDILLSSKTSDQVRQDIAEAEENDRNEAEEEEQRKQGESAAASIQGKLPSPKEAGVKCKSTKPLLW